jgi:glycosyltransferase involved in cell wall biosynthesis
MSTIAIVTGTLPPDVCGCGDFVAKLADEFQRQGMQFEIFLRRDWRLRFLLPYALALKQLDAACINIQYPTESYGYSIVPMLLCALLRRNRTIVTLHEFTSKSLQGKAAIYLFFLFATWVIFTTQFERNAACRVAPWLERRSSVIPIGSNIPLQPPQLPDADIVYFGLIRPMKGIEQFISTMRAVTRQKGIRIRAVGQIVPKYDSYAANVVRQFRELGAEVILDADADHVSEALSRSRIAFLPFPDGMSQRRGSALAAMGNGALVVTSASANEPDRYRDTCAIPGDDITFDQFLLRVLDHYDDYQPIRNAGLQYARSISWEGVSLAYNDLFRFLRREQ